ncbi:MAG: pyridoxamine kinase [Acutalibacteraceae bacterium]|nr:pyridoxamine kinase [Acutalibacteraceae bacterium]
MNRKVLTIQDISCVGQCSLTVALPIISACGIETAILPSAVLSNHTAFSEFTFCDLTDEMPNIRQCWMAQDIKFSALYTGYLGSAKQISIVKEVILDCIEEGGLKIVDPAMADGGKLYTGFDMAYVEEMKKLCREADIILPNITEACLMTDTEYKTCYDRDYIEKLLARLKDLCGGNVILTGVAFDQSKNGVAVLENDQIKYYEHDRVGAGCHGTGDVYASAFVGALMQGNSLFDAAKIAADFTLLCIKNTVDHSDHWYGVRFETCLSELINMIK